MIEGTFKNFFKCLFLRERVQVGEGQRARRRHRIRSRLQAPSCQHRARRGARTHRPRDQDLSRSRTLNRLSHPGAPRIFSLSTHPMLGFLLLWFCEAIFLSSALGLHSSSDGVLTPSPSSRAFQRHAVLFLIVLRPSVPGLQLTDLCVHPLRLSGLLLLLPTPSPSALHSVWFSSLPSIGPQMFSVGLPLPGSESPLGNLPEPPSAFVLPFTGSHHSTTPLSDLLGDSEDELAKLRPGQGRAALRVPLPRCPGGITVLLVRRRKLRLAGSLRGRRPRHRGSTPGLGCEPLAVSVASHCQGGDGLLATQNPLVPLSGFLHGSRGWRMWTGAWRPGALGFPRASDPKCAASRPALVWELVTSL
ncbi:uncharacterized protein LOC125917974 [Panthera uncia]|uniref:uncharacterized protein LOC125917145 n=1 Tax=Panthera uncia TaxID=29064 RepID=UPI0020FF937F|nr:uncharacterized protein LOC125917145 [Panthera uncia]XP_049479365.1 uncharacterized protein LOC125917145 [Panthera uncia]XP_049479366.1 uncharacterized protein LOC125917145 [Panthera uncia]XP_049479986.1 uncharacterized protein LOC125917974 [Panthera uncia]XP_049479987.1 uncharacterized protein LOC125917974 [Panthera uncia]